MEKTIKTSKTTTNAAPSFFLSILLNTKNTTSQAQSIHIIHKLSKKYTKDL